MSQPATEAFKIEYHVPSNALSLWPVVFVLVVPAALGYSAATVWPNSSIYAPVAGVAFLVGLLAMVHGYRQTRGSTRFTASVDGLDILERPGRRRRVALADITKIVPKQREDPYERGIDEAFLMIDLQQGRCLRVPENPAYSIPVELAEETARRILWNLRQFKRTSQ